MGLGRTLVPESAEETLALTAKAVGRIQGLEELMKIHYDEEGE